MPLFPCAKKEIALDDTYDDKYMLENPGVYRMVPIEDNCEQDRILSFSRGILFITHTIMMK